MGLNEGRFSIAGALAGAILGAVLGPSIAAWFTTVYVFQEPQYRILGAIIGLLLGGAQATRRPSTKAVSDATSSGAQVSRPLRPSAGDGMASSHGSRTQQRSRTVEQEAVEAPGFRWLVSSSDFAETSYHLHQQAVEQMPKGAFVERVLAAARFMDENDLPFFKDEVWVCGQLGDTFRLTSYRLILTAPDRSINVIPLRDIAAYSFKGQQGTLRGALLGSTFVITGSFGRATWQGQHLAGLNFAAEPTVRAFLGLGLWKQLPSGVQDYLGCSKGDIAQGGSSKQGEPAARRTHDEIKDFIGKTGTPFPNPWLWMTWSIVPLVFWAAWVHAYMQTKRRTYLWAAAFYAIPLIIGLALPLFCQGTKAAETDWFNALFGLTWVAHIVHVLIKSREVARLTRERASAT